jgi:hypothetical protein
MQSLQLKKSNSERHTKNEYYLKKIKSKLNIRIFTHKLNNPTTFEISPSKETWNSGSRSKFTKSIWIVVI